MVLGRKLLLIAVLAASVLSAYASDTISIPLHDKSSARKGRLACFGEFTLDGQRYAVWLTGTLRKNPVRIQPTRMHVTANEDEGYECWQQFPDILGVGGRLYQVSFQTSVKTLDLVPFEDDLIPVALPVDAQRISLTRKYPTRSLLLYRPGRQVMLPMGCYVLREYQLEQQDPKGARWSLSARGARDGPILGVLRKEKAALDIGGPYVTQVRVDERSLQAFQGSQRQNLLLRHVLEGRWKETVSRLSPIGKSTQPPPPAFTIRDSKGAVVAHGSFRYG